MTALIVMVLNVTYAGVVFHGPVLGNFMSYGISMNLLTTALSTGWLAIKRRQLPYICVADSFMAVLFAQGGTRMLSGKLQHPSAAFSTLAASMALTTFLLGVAYVLMGCAKVCKVVQFVPSPVMAGYQASIGFLLLDSAASLCSGCSLVRIVADRPECNLPLRKLLELLVAFAMGLFLFLVQQRRSASSVSRIMWIPSMLVVSTILFSLAKWLLPSSWEPELDAWTLFVPDDQSVFSLSSVLSISSIDWPLVLQEALLTTLTALVPNVIGKLLQYSAIEQKFDVDIDYNTEIQHNGFSQLFATVGVMTPTVTYLGMVVAHDLGARSHIAPILVIASSTAFFFFGSQVVRIVPKAMFAALLVSSGLSMLADNLRQAWNNFPKREFALVILHVALTAILGMLYAVVLGLLFTAVIFIIQYSRHSGVLQHATLLLERSKVARTVAEQQVLEEFGATTLIVHLHGMIFFGSANSVVEEVRAHLDTLRELNLPLRFLLLDFDRCSAIDSSAVAVLLQTRRLIKTARLICACAGTDVLNMLSKGASIGSGFEHFTTLDLALEHCENRLFDFYAERRDASPSLSSPVVRHSMGLLRKADVSREAEHEAEHDPARRRDSARSDGNSSAADAGASFSSRAPSDDGTSGYGGVAPSHHDVSEVVVYSPEEARLQLEDGALTRLRKRFMETVSESYGTRDLDELVDFMDVILVPPQTVISTYPHDEETGEERYLYVLDRGYVSAFATLEQRRMDHHSLSSESGSDAVGSSRHRLAKYGPGTVLGVSSFVMPLEMPDLTIMPMVTISDTSCQLLRLPRSRCDALEASHPALLFRLYRLLVIVSERRLQDHRMRVVAAEAFKVNVIPSTDFQRMLVADPNNHGERTDPALDYAPAPAPSAVGGGSHGEEMAGLAPAVSPPASRRDLIPASNSRDRMLIPSSGSRDRDMQSRAGHQPQAEAMLSNFQAALIKDRKRDRDMEREAEERERESSAPAAAPEAAAPSRSWWSR